MAETASAPEALPLVAIIGRANVGKSTLFNRLTQSNQALVADTPGVTRDRLLGRVTFGERTFLLADTGGLIGAEDELEPLIRRQAEAAVAAADLILLVMDGKTGPLPADEEVAAYLRETGKPVLLVVNKVDHLGREEVLPEFYRFGFTPLYPVSAAHRLGLEELLTALVRLLPPKEALPPAPEAIRVAVVGRPNVGKSSLINRLLGEERFIVSERPGTTRDSIDTPVTVAGRDYVLIDTAGLRRPAQRDPGLERLMALKAIRALERAQVAVLLLDASEGVTAQDLRIARLIAEEAKGCLVGLNKWDLVPREARKEVQDRAREALNFLPYAPLLPLSALTGFNVGRLFPLVDRIYAQMGLRVGTGELNRVLQEITGRVKPPLFQFRPVKFYYLTQPETHPPTFVAFVNYPEGVTEAYRRYFIRQLRERLGLTHTPLRLFLKKRRR